MGESVIELVGLTKQYDSLTAVNHLNLNIRKGEVFGLLGPNGAGKSTTILMMLGLTEPTSGTVRVCGIDPLKHPLEVKRKVGYMPDDIGFYENYSGLDNLLYTAGLNRIPVREAEERAMQLLERVGLRDVAHKKAGKYSRGMRQRLGLADVLIKDPEIIILDEPTLGIDPQGIREFLELIIQLSSKEGITVLLSSHHLHHVQQVCDRVGIFVEGKLLAEGDVSSLSAQLFPGEPYVIEAGAVPGSGTTGNWQAALADALQQLDGVSSVRYEEDKFRISCTHDLSAAISRFIVEKGYDLVHLNRKTYALDDIYQRYFEGGKAHA
ncbi:ABC transporter ATP-binding protein [Pedobacter sp. BS3]|uniref:ABC transporter ATP-binding protein n=1 Tax=Pedobacter sp. BS3 TaxID=2567937 RepID=UPI0011EE15AE|nr:ABC transporter ATP-binding protein [Pedobacter sp. BS3]TZF81167.1 ABC transporter ATP-binding protein [Pedobacter sp. BS3]